MRPKVKRADAARPARNGRDDALAWDWEAAVHAAFIEGCLREGARAEAAAEALRSPVSTWQERELRDDAKAAELAAALGWLRIETCLARYGELAALALARLLDETALEIRLRAIPAQSRGRAVPAREDALSSLSPAELPSGVLPKYGVAHGLAVVQRGRERLMRFWDTPEFRAA